MQALQQAEHVAAVARDAEKAEQQEARLYAKKQKQLEDQLAALKQVRYFLVQPLWYYRTMQLFAWLLAALWCGDITPQLVGMHA